MAKPRTPLHTRSRPLSELDLRTYRTVLTNLQGNILKGHGRDHTVQIFIEFRRGKQAAAKKWLADLSGQLTSMQCQLEEQHEYSAYRIPGSLFHSVLLTAAGYEYLGFETGKFDPRFQAGMKKSRTALSDPPVDQWEKPYHQTIHCMILLADDGELFIDRYGRDMINRIKAGN